MNGLIDKEDNVMSKVAVVTGASRGFGRAIARRLAQDGFVVVVSYLRDAAEANGLVAEIIRMGGDARAIKADVANQFWVKSFFEEIAKALGRIDVVVNNAQVLPLQPFDEPGNENEAMSTNLRGTFLVLAQAAQRVVDGGRIIVVSSSAQARSDAAYAPRRASEERVEAYLYRLASELRERNVSVNVIACGPDPTGFSLENKTKEQSIHLGKHGQLERQEQPADIAGVVSFLAGPDGHLVTSQVLCASSTAA
jgi:3-oxoacyl-[acyl-carrier protein] reductase